MKSLQIVEESNKETIIKKEEKEDDNMNNGNFFPNFDNNQMNNNSSLNMMNMQSMNAAPMNAAPEMVLPTMTQPESVPTPMAEQAPVAPQQPMGNPIPEQQPPIMAPQPMPMENNPTPDFSQFGAAPNPGFDMNMGMNPMPNPMAEQPMMAPQPMPMENNPIPDFGQFGAQPMEAQPSMMAPDAPLFNQDVVMPSPMAQPMPEQPIMAPEQSIVPVENTGFDVPVAMPTNTMDQSSDKLAALTNYLSTNGYNFKSFNGATGNCIIIEM